MFVSGILFFQTFFTFRVGNRSSLIGKLDYIALLHEFDT